MLNSISMVGRLTRDPELRQTNSGTSVVNFAIACDDRPGPDGVKPVVFIDCTAFGALSDIVMKFFRKGNLIAIQGRLTQRKYTNKDNVQVTRTEILVRDVEFVESKADRESQAPASAPVQAPAAQPDNGVVAANNTQDIDVTDEDLPF